MDDPPEPSFSPAETLPSEPPDLAFTRCIRFRPCGHVFEREDIYSISDALREYQSLKRELRTTESPTRIKALKEYELPAHENRIRNLKQDATRRPKAEQTGGSHNAE